MSKTIYYISILIGGMLFFILLEGFLTSVQAASSSVTHTSQNDFQQGTVSENLEINRSSGDITLKQNKSVLSDTFEDSLRSGTRINIAPSEVNLTLSEYVNYGTEYFGINIDDYGLNLWVNEVNNAIYFSTVGGLFVIDQNTLNDISDDVVVAHYSSTSTPSLGVNQVNHTYLDIETDLLYISAYGSGLIVIDTNGTLDLSDDSIVSTYSTSSTPAISSNNIFHSYFDKTTDLLYISQNGGGLSVIDTNGTATQTDDTLQITYSTTSSPSIAGNIVKSSIIDSVNNLLYIPSYGSGLNVIDTKGTLSALDDEKIFTYSTASTPAISDNNILHVTIDMENDLLYLSTLIGIIVIDRKGTVDTSDDELLITYNYLSTPALGEEYGPNPALNSWTESTYLDSDEGLLYASSSRFGVAIIDTNLTIDPADDTIHKTYNWKDGIGHQDTRSYSTYLDKTNSRLYISTYNGVYSVYLESKKTRYGEYISKAKKISQTPTDLLTFTSDLPPNTTVGIQYRTTGVDGVWEDNFDSSDVSHITDYYSWGAPFNNVETINGILTMSDPLDTEWMAMWIDTEKNEEYFPAGSVVRMKVRSNIGIEELVGPYGHYGDFVFTDEWESDYAYYYTINEWVYLTIIPSLPFSKIGVEPYFASNSSFRWQSTDSYEIDWVSIEQPDSEWSQWSDICYNAYGCDIDPLDLDENGYIQYKLTFTTTDTSVTPSVAEVSFNSGYQPSGEYISKVIDGGRNTKWNEIEVSSTLPSGTTISRYTRTGDSATPNNSWSDWNLATENTINSKNGRYMQYKLTLSTTDEEVTPVVQSIKVEYDTDTHGPHGNIVIGGGQESTTWPYVWLTTIAQDGMSKVTSMRICNNSSFTSCPWKTYSEGGYWALLAGTGTREVFVQFRDSEGNTSKVYRDTIELIASTTQDDDGEGNSVDPDNASESTFTVLKAIILNEVWVVSEKRPTFSGKTYKNATVKITINSKVIEGETKADDEGYWAWSPEEDLEEGEHKITLNIINGTSSYTDIYRMKVDTTSSPVKPHDENPATLNTGKSNSSPNYSTIFMYSFIVIILVSIIAAKTFFRNNRQDSTS